MRRFIVALTALFMCVGVASAQKYIVVDSEKIFRSIADYNTAMTTLDNLAKEYQTKVDATYAEVESLYNAYIAQKANLSTAQRNAKEQEILAKERAAADYQESVFGNDGVLMKKRIELIQPIQKRVFGAIDSYAKAGGYDMVLDSASNAAMLYYSESVNHTQKIIELLK
ncbi:MAG: OmpH family outer membrane protein [Rikenellaceae bacterium]|nr:OmpH family outer membrane protein [Rikenellaceae bacterium]